MQTQKGSDGAAQDGAAGATTATTATPAGHVTPVDGSTLEYAAVPVFLFAAVATAMAAGMPIIGSLFGPKRQGDVKAMPYESGMDPIHDTRRRFDVRFHLVAIAFLVFDVELLFLYPWAVAMRPAHHVSPTQAVAVSTAEPGATTAAGPVAKQLPASAVAVKPALGIDQAVESGVVESRGLVFGGTMVFIALLTVGLVYDWKKGVFQWR